MISKSTSRTFYVLVLIVFVSILSVQSSIQSFSQCATRPFPASIPLRLNETVMINLEDYFEGSNLTYTATPNNSFSSIQPSFTCSSLIGQRRFGKILASRYIRVKDEEVIVMLSMSMITEGVFSLLYLQLSNNNITTINLPKESIANCSAFVVISINSTHFAPTIDCKDSNKFYSRLLLTGIAQVGSPYVDWTSISAPLFTYQNNSVQIEYTDGILIRGIYSIANSYIQLWSWTDQARQLVFVYDKTFVGTSTFNIKSMQLHGNILAVLQYHTGLHWFRVSATRTLVNIGLLQQPFYEQFEYNPVTGLLYLGRKGKIVSSKIDLQTGSFPMIGESFNIYKYENIRKIISDSKLLVLGESMINIFSIAHSASQTRHLELYETDNIQTFYLRQIIGQGTSLLVIQNRFPNAEIQNCVIRSAYLKLSTPDTQQPVNITAFSHLDDQKSSCSQIFLIKKVTTEADLIYDNGYHTDNEILYANMLGEGTVELAKYGLGKNLNYKVTPNDKAKIEFTAVIRKSENFNCSFQNKIILNGGVIHVLKSIENLIIVQFSSDLTLRYYICKRGDNLACTYGLDNYKLKLIKHMAHETTEKTAITTVIYEAILQQQKDNSTILINKITADNVNLEIINEYICRLDFSNTTTEGYTITQLSIVSGRLFVVMPQRKEIRIYNLQADNCPSMLIMNTQTCKWGYFAPQKVHFDKPQGLLRHQNVLVQQWDELLFVQLEGNSQTLRPILLSKNSIPFVKNYSILFTYPYLLIFQQTQSQVYTYFLDDRRELSFLRNIQLGGSFNSSEQKKDYAILLDSRHVVIKIKSNNLIKALIFKIDQIIPAAEEYLAISLGNNQTLVWYESEGQRVAVRAYLLPGIATSTLLCKGNATYLSPSVRFKFGEARISPEEYSENVSLVLSTADQINSHKIKISLSNVGNNLKRGYAFPSRGASIKAEPDIIINQQGWFLGSVFNYEFDCQDCGNRIKFRSKVTKEEQWHLPVPMNYFWIERQAQIVKSLMGNFAVEMEYNYSAWPINPQIDGSKGYGVRHSIQLTNAGGNCMESKSVRRANQLISICWNLNHQGKKEYYLSLVSTASYKTFVIEQIGLNLEESETQPKVIINNDIILVYSPKLALIFTLWEIQGDLKFVQLDQIDREDIQSTICSAELISNSTSTAPITELLYYLIITQCSSSIYFTSFSIYLEKQEALDERGILYTTIIPNIHVSSSQNIDLIRLLAQKHIQIPSQAVVIETLVKREKNQDITLLTIFDKFHSYDFTIKLSKGIIISMIVSSVYYKYGPYDAVSAENGNYLVIKYIHNEGKGRLGEIYGFFDYQSYSTSSDSVKEYHMFEAYSLGFYGYRGQQTPWQLQGHTIIQFNNQYLEVLNISNLLRAHISNFDPNNPDDQNDTLYTQNILVTVNNPRSARSATIILKNIDRIELTAWEITLIVIGSIVFVTSSVILGRFGYKRYKIAKKMVPLLEDIKVEDASLEQDEQERLGFERINLSLRGSIDPVQI